MQLTIVLLVCQAASVFAVQVKSEHELSSLVKAMPWSVVDKFLLLPDHKNLRVLASHFSTAIPVIPEKYQIFCNFGNEIPSKMQ